MVYGIQRGSRGTIVYGAKSEDWCCGERCPKLEGLAAKPATTGAPLTESSSKGATLEGLGVPIAREVASG